MSVAVMTAPQGAAAGWHRPVLVNEVLELLAPRPGAVIVDGTAGTGGHSLAIAPRLLPDGRLLALDRDRSSLAVAASRLAEFSPIASTVHANYRELPAVLQGAGLSRIDGLLLDLGMSSPQVDEPARGFSFLREGPLDMRMDISQPLTARDIVNTWGAEELAELFHALGEERFARRIAQRIVRERRDAAIDTTTQLARIIAGAVPPGARHGRLHPATRSFQALRMAVNDELGALRELLDGAAAWLAPGGRLVIISFHSLEDRMVKHAFLAGQRAGQWRVLTKKPVQPGEDEERDNPRARSAKLRAAERLA